MLTYQELNVISSKLILERNAFKNSESKEYLNALEEAIAGIERLMSFL